MIIKKLTICGLLLLIVKVVSCQVLDTCKIESFFDADSVYLGTFYKTNGKIDSTIYLDIKKNKVNVLFKLPEYKYGYDSLNIFLLDKFRKQINYEEVNGAALVYILLVNNKIREIRIGKRIGYNCKYDPIIRNVLMKTQGKWIVSKFDKRRPILFVYLFKMK